MTTKFQKARLLKLADMLETDAANDKGIKFNLCTVISPEDLASAEAKGAVAMNCGTSACAMGLAALSGAFKRGGGLSYRFKTRKWGEVEIVTTISGKERAYDRSAMSVFGLTMREADFLFTPGSYGDHEPIRGAEGERYVAKRIRDFVKDRSIALA